MSLIDKIKEAHPLEEYIEKITDRTWKKTGSWKDLGECPFCSHHDFMFKDGTAYCFACMTFSGDAIHFRSLYENISYKDAMEKFREEMGIKKVDKRDIEWVSLREAACEYLREVLFTCPTKYQFRGESIKPMHYLTDIRKHSYEAILHFRIGFNDGTLIKELEKSYPKDIIKGSGLTVIPDGCFTFPYMANGEIKYFRIKDPNEIKRTQMPLTTRLRNAYFYNQDALKESKEIFIVEGENDVISLWDQGVQAIGTTGNISIVQINYLKGFNPDAVYSCFDADPEGKRDQERLIRNYDSANLFVIKISEGKDIDDLIKEAINPEDLIEHLKASAELPSPELKTIIKQKPEGYYIDKYHRENVSEKRLTNWIFDFEAVIIRDDERMRKGILKSGKYETTVYIPGATLASVIRLREFLLNNANRILYFTGKDDELNALVQYWEVAYNPKVVRESDCVGEIDEGFISENVFISNSNEFRPLNNGFLSLDDKYSIRIVELVRKGGNRSELPYFPLIEPPGGIDAFKSHILKLMVKNRNLKVALGIGWLKAVLWSKQFFGKYRFFPIFFLHGKHGSGKTKTSEWLMSLIGLRDCLAETIAAKGGTTENAMGRKLAYYSSLPVFVDDYRNDESGQKFHNFFRGLFNRSSASKALKEDGGIRRVIIRGGLLLNGENSPTDPGLLSRLISIELIRKERTDKYFKEIMNLEPQFACIGLHWLRNKNPQYEEFISKYQEIKDTLNKELDDPRQAEVWSIPIAAALTEPVFNKADLISFSIKSIKQELEEQKGEELIGSLWECVEILKNKDVLKDEVFNIRSYDKLVEVHLPGLLGAIRGDPATRHYYFPNHREVAKVLKQEPYILEFKNTRVNKVMKRWVLDLKTMPDNIQSLAEDETKQDDKRQDDDI